MRPPVIIESPLAGCVPINVAYLHACIRDCLDCGETPYASHKMLPGALDDLIPEERELGITAGLDMRQALIDGCGATVAYYVDLGWSSGMKRAYAAQASPLEKRELSESAWERVFREGVCSTSEIWSIWNDTRALRDLRGRELVVGVRDEYLRRIS